MCDIVSCNVLIAYKEEAMPKNIAAFKNNNLISSELGFHCFLKAGNCEILGMRMSHYRSPHIKTAVKNNVGFESK